MPAPQTVTEIQEYVLREGWTWGPADIPGRWGRGDAYKQYGQWTVSLILDRAYKVVAFHPDYKSVGEATSISLKGLDNLVGKAIQKAKRAEPKPPPEPAPRPRRGPGRHRRRALKAILAEEGLLKSARSSYGEGSYRLEIRSGTKSHVYLTTLLSATGPTNDVLAKAQRAFGELDSDALQVGRSLAKLGLPSSLDESWTSTQGDSLKMTKIVSFLSPSEVQEGHVVEVMRALGRRETR